MKSMMRKMIGFSFAVLYVSAVRIGTNFRQREELTRAIGNHLTQLAKRSLKYWVPYIKDASEFDLLRSEMKKNLKLWSPLFDVEVVADDHDIFKVHVYNCPFCEAFIKLGMPELAASVCQGDWEKAKSNRHKWLFDRKHQIGTGDSFCDHTYMRIPKDQVDK